MEEIYSRRKLQKLKKGRGRGTGRAGHKYQQWAANRSSPRKRRGRGGDFLCAAAVAGGFSFSVLAFCRLFWVLSCLLCSTSLPRGNQVDGLPRAVGTGAVVASWQPRRRATINTFAKKIKAFDKFCEVKLLRIFIFHLVWYVRTNLMQIFKWKRKSTEEVYHRRNFKKWANLGSNFGSFKMHWKWHKWGFYNSKGV